MKSLGTKNFRSIKDSGEIELKPITVFLGKNNCGKSSFLRLLPLLKQSLETDTSEPLLWYGNYVDFGSYKNILPINYEKEQFEISFHISMINDGNFPRELYPGLNEKAIEYCVKIKFAENSVASYIIEYCDQKIECVFEKDKNVKYYVGDGKEFINFNNKYYWYRKSRDLLPYVATSNNLGSFFPMKFYFMEDYFQDDDTTKRVIQILQSIAKKKFNDKDIFDNIASFLKPQSKDDLLRTLKKNKLTKISAHKMDFSDKQFIELNEAIVVCSHRYIVHQINKLLHTEFEKVFYLKPIRASVSRYYRIQGLSIDNVDSDGSNLPMVLYSLGDEKKRFEKWCKDKFGLVFSVFEENGQMSLVVEERNEKTNLADTGYGYSQVLPLLVQAWLLWNSRILNDNSSIGEYIIVIEQPELHLHPAFQAKLMEMFVSLVKESQKKKKAIKIIFETHSDTMINKLGAMVSDGEISSDSVNIVLVEKKNGESLFTQTSYNKEGYIEKWPVGFLSSED